MANWRKMISKHWDSDMTIYEFIVGVVRRHKLKKKRTEKEEIFIDALLRRGISLKDAKLMAVDAPWDDFWLGDHPWRMADDMLAKQDDEARRSREQKDIEKQRKKK